MAQVVMVHGIGQQHKGENTLLTSWHAALLDGLTRAGAGTDCARDDAVVAFYGDLFRPPGQRLAAGDPPYTHQDVAEGFETELLMAWWQSTAEIDSRVVAPDADTLARSPRSAQKALRALYGSSFFSRVGMRALISDLKQVSRYLSNTELRHAARKRVLARISPHTRVVVAHSLGSVVAYEALCTMPDHPVKSFVTLGSPLGMRLIFDRLDPEPASQGVWPGGAQPGFAWTNVADLGDPVAAIHDLIPRFGSQVRAAQVHNGPHAHGATSYLTAGATGQAIAIGLAHG